MSHAFSFLRTAAWLSAATGALVLTGCVVAPVDDGYYGGSAPYYSTGSQIDGHYNGTYYPAIPYEVAPVAPYAGAVWVQGVWTQDNGRHYWQPGRYERPGWSRPDRNDRPSHLRPNDNRPDWSHVDRPNNRPNGDRPNSDRPNWNRPNGDRPNNGRPNPNRPPSHHFAPPNQPSGNSNRPSGGILRPAPGMSGSQGQPPTHMRPSPQRPTHMLPPGNVRPSYPSQSGSSREFLNRKDLDRGG